MTEIGFRSRHAEFTFGDWRSTEVAIAEADATSAVNFGGYFTTGGDTLAPIGGGRFGLGGGGNFYSSSAAEIHFHGTQTLGGTGASCSAGAA